MKLKLLTALFVAALSALAQSPIDDSGPTPVGQSSPLITPVTLSQPAEHAGNFVNYFLFGNGIYDSGYNRLGSSEGLEAGGGVTANHVFRSGSVGLSYRGSYREYSNSGYIGGTDQNLSLYVRRTLGRRWSVSLSQTAGIFRYGGTYFTLQPNDNVVQLNPLSESTKFLGTAVSGSYQKSLRLSFQVSGNFYLSRYTGGIGTSYGSTGAGANAAVIYRFTRRTTASGNYSFNQFNYQHSGGTARVNTLSLGLSHQFNARWETGLAAGGSRAQTFGTIQLALPPLLAQAFGVDFLFGSYDHVTYLPYFDASLTYHWRRAQATGEAGQSVSPGNGVYVASRNQHANGFYSTNRGKASYGIGAGYSRLGSISNTAKPYNTANITTSYGYNLTQHIGLSLRYDYTHYDGFAGYRAFNDDRVTLGFVFNSRNVPITLF